MSALKFLTLFKKYHGEYKKIDGSLSKVKKSSAAIGKMAKGKPDPHELRAALIGSPLNKEIAKLKPLAANLAKMSAAASSGSLVEGLPDFTWNDLKDFISRSPGLEDMERFRGNMQGAKDILFDRFKETLGVSLTANTQLQTVEKVLSALNTLEAVLRKFLRVPGASSVVGPVWFDIQMELLPLCQQMQGSLASTVKSIDKMHKHAIKRDKLYKDLLKTIHRMIAEEKKKAG